MLKSVSTQHVLNRIRETRSKEARSGGDHEQWAKGVAADTVLISVTHEVIEMLGKFGFVVAKDVPEEPEPMADLTALTLTGLSDDELFIATIRAIQRAAQGEANGGNEPAYTIAMDHLAESDRRLAAQGHKERCRTGIYSQAYAAATALHSGDRSPRTLTCNCGAVSA
jgi:hypothetical protein